MKPQEEGQGSAFAAALRAAISDRRITLSRLQSQLKDDGNPVSLATLSYWRSGDRQPEGAQSLSVVEGIEDRLGVGRGYLTGLLGPSARLGPIAAPRLPFDEERQRREVGEALRALRATPQDSYRELSSNITAFVGKHGAIERVVLRSLLQATKGAVSEVSIVDVPPTEPEEWPELSVVGARVGRTYLHPGRRVAGMVLVLDQPIATGATTIVEITRVYPAGYPARQAIWHTVSRASRETLIWVKFAPGAMPNWCEEYTETEEDYVLLQRSAASGSVHIARHGFGPGTLGIRWGYDE